MAELKTLHPYLALLRGINVGGKNKLAMKDLIGFFVDAGCRDVRTYIQSGNVIFHADQPTVRELSARLATRIEQRFGYRIPIVLRTVAELATTVTRNPFLAAGGSAKMLHVYFLSSVPSAEDIAGLDLERSAPDVFQVRGRDIYVQLPNGMTRTKLTNAYFDSKLSTTSSARNWNTVLQLYDLMKG